jgi:CBS domain-containing protein
MIARELITDEIPPLRITDTGLKALTWMDEFKVAHLPVVKKTEYIGLISDTDVLDMEHAEEPLKNQKLQLIRPFVYENVHIYDVMRLIADLKLSVVPVLDVNDKYLGLTHVHHLIKVITKTAALESPGGIIVLEVAYIDYSLSEIAQIVEGNESKILSVYVTSVPNSTMLEVTLKVNRQDLSRILQTFHRYEYTIKASYHENMFGDDMRNRYESFMNFLNI